MLIKILGIAAIWAVLVGYMLLWNWIRCGSWKAQRAAFERAKRNGELG